MSNDLNAFPSTGLPQRTNVPHSLSRAEQVGILKNGGSVMVVDPNTNLKKIVISEADLPSEAVMAARSGDVAQMDLVRADLDAQIADLKAQLDLLKAAASGVTVAQQGASSEGTPTAQSPTKTETTKTEDVSPPLPPVRSRNSGSGGASGSDAGQTEVP